MESHHAEGTPAEAENGIEGQMSIKEESSDTCPVFWNFDGSVLFLPKKLAPLWFPELSHTCTVASNLCSHTPYFMNPRTEHDTVHPWRPGHRLPWFGEAVHWGNSASYMGSYTTVTPPDSRRRTTLLGRFFNIRHSVTREHPPHPHSLRVFSAGSLSPHLPLFNTLLCPLPSPFSYTHGQNKHRVKMWRLFAGSNMRMWGEKIRNS